MKILASLALVLLLAGCGGGASDEAKAPVPIALVKTATAMLGATRDEVAVYGAAEAAPGGERAVVVPTEALVARIDAPTGTLVRAGQAILTLRPSPTSKVEAAKANGDAATATAAYQRALRLRKDGLVADADVETARAAMIAAQTAVNVPRVGMQGLVLRAPIAGVVQGLTVKLGDQVAAGTTVASIAAKGDLRARFGVDPQVAQRIHVGEPIQVSTIAGGAPIPTIINGVDPQIDATTRLASIYARIPASAGIGPGEPVHGNVTVSGSANGITIPYSALLDDGGRSYVFVIEGDTAKSRDVSPGSSSGSTIRILKGLKPGERVVTEGGTALEDGMKVRQDNSASATPGAAK